MSFQSIFSPLQVSLILTDSLNSFKNKHWLSQFQYTGSNICMCGKITAKKITPTFHQTKFPEKLCVM